MPNKKYLILFPVCFLFLLLLAFAIYSFWGHSQSTYNNVSFRSLAGWKKDDTIYKAVDTLLRSCAIIQKKCPHCLVAQKPLEIQAKDFNPICTGITYIDRYSNKEITRFLEQHFVPLRVKNTNSTFFTGYYAISFAAARKKDEIYKYPIYKRPKDLISIHTKKNPHDFGRLVGNKIVPYYTREEIENGALKHQNLEILWAKNPLDVFFLHIQGTGIAYLKTGGAVVVAYDGTNGQKYTSIGKKLIDMKLIKKEEVSMKTIRQTLSQKPEIVNTVLNSNESYIFFKINQHREIAGAQGTELIPERSLAVDREYIPLGFPIWVATKYPDTKHKMEKLMFSQDVGSAIKGASRADIYWGSGKEAAYWAGKTKTYGTMYLLVPKISFDRNANKKRK